MQISLLKYFLVKNTYKRIVELFNKCQTGPEYLSLVTEEKGTERKRQ
jgi:hypothetical protein